jgi:hypothetical protein
MPTGSIKGSTLLIYLDTDSNQTLNLFVMKERTLVAVVGTCNMEHVLLAGTAVSGHTCTKRIAMVERPVSKDGALHSGLCQPRQLSKQGKTIVDGRQRTIVNKKGHSFRSSL